MPRAPTKKSAVAKPTTRKRKAAAPAGTKGLTPDACRFGVDAPELAEVVARVADVAGITIGAYRDPYGGKPLLMAIVPLASVAPTPFQRDLSEAHHVRLAGVIEKTARFLDPIIVVPAPSGGFWTPNGRHRLAALERLGARAITVLVVPEREVAWQILALNTEKAHNLKERSLEVVRIEQDLVSQQPDASESSFAFYLEDPALVTIGACYEKNARFAGASYHAVLRRCEHFSDGPIRQALVAHRALADQTLAIDARVVEVMAALRERGFQSPYLRSFVVARINPIRFVKGEPPPAASVLATMLGKAQRFDVGKVKQEDIARTGGVPDEEVT